jgi:MoxR-like ATPase
MITENENEQPIAPETPIETNEWAQGIQDHNKINVQPLFDSVDRVKNEIGKVVIGQEETIELLMAAMLVGGHVLLEGLPGIAKTLTAKLLAKCIHSDFSRIQFTPDLMPTDVTGSSVFNLKENNFYFRKGPIFSNLILIDEINRSPAKTQAALMEVMEEKQLTYDGTTHQMGFPFFVIATQNPVEQEGTYSLPEAQLDRFVFKLKMGYPGLQQELEILQRFEPNFSGTQSNDVVPVISKEELHHFFSMIEKVYIRPELLAYIAAVVHNTRNNPDLHMGASPRASLAIMKAAKALAAMRGRNFVTPDDIRTVAIPALNHRLIISHEREMEGLTVEEIIADILKTVEVPR